MNSFYLKVSVYLSLGLTILTSSLTYATDGPIGATSTGTTAVSLTIPELIKVSNMNDMSFPTWNGTGNIITQDSVCVYDNSGGAYSATFTGSGTGNAFTLSGAGVEAPYSVLYQSGAISFPTSGTAITGLTGAHQTSSDCGGSTNGTIIVSVAEATLATFPATTYTGTLTMLVAPE